MHRFLCLMLGLVIPVVVVASAAAQTAASTADKPTEKATAKVTQFEVVPPNEDAQIDSVVSLTVQQMKNRYPGATTALRGVHPKDHGCVKAAFEVLPELPKELQVGLFDKPGRKFEAVIRYSNSAALVAPDSIVDPTTNATMQASRGMAIKVMGVTGFLTSPQTGPASQDFLLVNHPVFAFANVEDYEVLSKILADPANKESAASFFPTQFAKGGDAKLRAQATLQIIGRIRSPALPAAYQLPPIHPAENHYFSGAPFLYGKDRAAKFRVKTTEAPSAAPNAADPNYLRAGLIKRLAPGSKPIELVFQVQLRTLESLKADVGGLNTQIENFCTEWSDAADKYPFVDVAKITIPAQEFDTPEQRAACERLAFTPWNSLEAHRPIGGINRMRKPVYEASAGFRQPMK